MDSLLRKETYRQSKECLLEDMDGEILLYNPATAKAIQLNESSLMVWKLCDGSRTVEDIIVEIGELYPGQASQISADVATVIASLRSSKVLEKLE